MSCNNIKFINFNSNTLSWITIVVHSRVMGANHEVNSPKIFLDDNGGSIGLNLAQTSSETLLQSSYRIF